MRIGFDVTQTCVAKAGCGWYADCLVRAMIRIAPENHYVLYHHFADLRGQDTLQGIAIDNLANVEMPFFGTTADHSNEIWRRINEGGRLPGDPSIVHSSSFRGPKLPGTKLIFTVFDTSFWMVPEFTTEANRLVCQNGTIEALKNADGFVFISQSARDEFERILPGWLERSGKPSAVTLLGPKPGYHRNDSSDFFNDSYWLAVGSLEPRKNYDALLDAMMIYWAESSRRIPMRIAGGSGWKSTALRSRINQLTESGMVRYLGYVADAELAKLYQNAHGFVFPSWYEGFGLPVLEAMACGCPVISSDRTSLREVGGTAAIYIDPGSPREIAAAMLRLESDPHGWTSCSNAVLDQAARFDWAKTARETLHLYRQVIDHAVA